MLVNVLLHNAFLAITIHRCAALVEMLLFRLLKIVEPFSFLEHGLLSSRSLGVVFVGGIRSFILQVLLVPLLRRRCT